MNLKHLLLLILSSFVLNNTSAQYLGLENSVPNYWTTTHGAKLSISNRHYKLGEESLQWDYTPESEININNPRGLQQALRIFQGGMMLWVYNENPTTAPLTFQFGANDKVEYHFNYGLNFSGWRACWIRFKEDMQGPKTRQDLTWMKIVAPKTGNKGTLFFDRMIFPKERIHNHVTPDAQLPYINPWMNENHWSALYFWESTMKHDIPLGKNITPQQKADLKTIQKRLLKDFKGSPMSEKAFQKITRKFEEWGIHRTRYGMVGLPFVSKDEAIKKGNDLTLEKTGKVLIKLAQYYTHTKSAKSKKMFIDLLDHMMEQGLAIGSGIGTNHHYGYQFRNYPPAILLMKDALKKEGKLHHVAQMIKYWTGVQEYRQKPEVGTLQGVMDSWNTTVVPRLMAILTQDDTADQIRELKEVKRWMDISLEIVPGTMGGIKIDGSGFHHGGLYPAYSNGGFAGIGRYLRYTLGTTFCIGAKAKETVALALRAMQNYTYDSSWGFGICGRHPLGSSMSTGAKETFAYLALSGDPHSGEKIWKEMAEAYLALEKGKSHLKKNFKRLGITQEKAHEGHYTFNYGALGIHRRANYMVTLKGYNKNVWGSEIYTKDNRYGRYQSYGTVQVLTGNSKKSGFVENGWDWNRYPGATSIHLPLELLDSPNKNTLMEKSKEGFAGSSNLKGENGIFAIKLMERNRERFTPDFRARKSVFAFDDMIICLGSNISNSNKKFPTETTLFQCAMLKKKNPQWIDRNIMSATLPLGKNLNNDKSHYLMDPYGNGYWVAPGSNLSVSQKKQQSRHNKTRKPTSETFASAWINHGTSPSNDNYHYTILPASSKEKVQKFAAAMDKASKAPYKVLQHDSVAHVVYHKASNTTGYAFFKGAATSCNSLVLTVSSPALVMVQQENSNHVTMSVCDPDLHIADNSFTSQKGSQPFNVKTTLKGKWHLNNKNTNCHILSHNTQTTIIEFTCIDGLPIEIKLIKK